MVRIFEFELGQEKKKVRKRELRKSKSSNAFPGFRTPDSVSSPATSSMQAILPFAFSPEQLAGPSGVGLVESLPITASSEVSAIGNLWVLLGLW